MEIHYEIKGAIWIEIKKRITGGNFDHPCLTSADLTLHANSNIKKMHDDKNLVIVEAKTIKYNESNGTEDEVK